MSESNLAKIPEPALPMTVGERSSKALKMLARWSPGHILPSGITPDLLYAAHCDASTALEPAPIEAFTVIFDRLFLFAETFTIKDADVRQAMRFYLETLDDVPPDLLEKAVDSVVRNYKYGHRLPPPADLRAVVEEELAARSNAKKKIETAQKFGKYEEAFTPPTDEEIAAAAKIVADVKRGFELERDGGQGE